MLLSQSLLNRAPLLALRYLEAVVRLGSFEAAAKELNVSASAISQQMSKLEAALNINLFERSPNRTNSNDRAVTLAKGLAEGFDLIESALNWAVADVRNANVKVRLYQTWANRWLVPRLESFATKFPSISVELETGVDAVDFSRTDADFAMAIRTVPSRSVMNEHLISPRLVPICCPALAARVKVLADLDRVTRIASRNRMGDWAHWMQTVRERPDDMRPMMVFSNSTLLYEAALSGAGIAIAQLELVLADIEAGRLVTPFPYVVSASESVALFEPTARARSREHRQFRTWFVDEMHALITRSDKLIASRGLQDRSGKAAAE